MDKIGGLPDELLLKVLLFLPTKVAVGTSVLSKRWEFLWMWLSKLDYNDNNCSGCKRLRSFVNLNLPLHKAPVIETLHLKFIEGCRGSIKREDITMWLVIVVSHGIRELSLNLYNLFSEPRARLPSSLYTSESLVVLKLTEEILVDVPRMAYLPSLKTLFLQCVTYSNKNSLHKFLSSCPILEYLVVERGEYTEFGYDQCDTLSIIVPSLQRLILRISRGFDFHRLLINTPCLKGFKVMDYRREGDSDNDSDSDNDMDNYSLECNDMHKMEEADIHSSYPDIDKFVRSIKYVKRLSLCISVNGDEEVLYREGIVFDQLQHLKLCSCVSYWPKLLYRLLKDSPNLRVLEVDIYEGHCYANPVLCLENQLNPECLFSSLKTFKWTGIYGTKQEMDMTKYVLRHACCLKIATILFQTPNELEEDYKVAMMIEELSLSFRGSKTCQLVFG